MIWWVYLKLLAYCLGLSLRSVLGTGDGEGTMALNRWGLGKGVAPC